MNILYLVTARGGSKGIPKKNICELGGMPLIAYRIISAKKSKYKGRIIVSTDNLEIADTAKEYGAEVPFIRPSYLASDTASSIDVVEHAIQWIEDNDANKYDYLCLLQPTSPFVSYKDLNRSLDLIIENNADTLIGVKRAEINRCFIQELDEHGRLSNFYYSLKNIKKVRRQDFEPEYTLNGGIYILSWKYFKKNKIFYSTNSIPYIMEDIDSVDIDGPIDFEFAKFLVERNVVDINLWK
ncbi:MAG: acylneuraminate cytidylyltransferase family protein [Streptococcaceae bacterium]|jgi:N-acylneuraminate cytidylyltransferase/CMP-N,N'-diacetyllegionaminic acid synthase|nr:acylneuraminate cytidylyltransferase family protein [Streptococcaceae bacterium]